MTQDLTPIRARLERADLHFKALYALVGDIINDKAYGTRRELEVDGAHHVYYAVVTDDLQRQITSCSLILSDGLHQIRAALDNLVHRLAELNLARTGDTVPDDAAWKLAFPIAKDPDGLKDQIRKGRLRYLTQEAVGLIESVQPYNHPQIFGSDTLLGLKDLQDIDKHRFVLTAVVNSEMLGYRFPPGIAASFVPGLGSNDPEGLKDGVELGRFIFDEPAPDVEVEFGPLLNVVFSKTGPGQGRPITQLGIWLAKVTTIVAAAENLP